jgi:O-antigen/teichoic acid export membrane protein
MSKLKRWWSFSVTISPPWGRLSQVGFSIADQAFSVGGMFVANVVLARAVSKEEYGAFTLAYSILNFLAGLHNAAILEPYTVYGAGRYGRYTPEYRWLVWRSNAWLGLALTILLVLTWRVLSWAAPALASRAVLGLALSSAVFLAATLLRRMFYVERKPRLAAKMSFIFFLTLLVLLGIWVKAGTLDALTTFLAIAIGSIASGAVVIRELPPRISLKRFLQAEPDHWSEHWKYARWVLATAFVFQFMTQAYYWLAAGFLSLKEVAGLRALTMIVMPVDQVFTAITFLVLPMMAACYASKQIPAFLSLWKKYLAAFLLIGAAFVSGVLLLGSSVMHWIYAGKFDDLFGLLRTLAPLPIVMGIGHTMNVALKSMVRPNMVFYAYVASGATTFLAGIPLIIRFGLRGTVYGMLLSAAVYTATLGIGFLSHRPRPYSQRMANTQEEMVVGQGGAA